MAAAGGGPSAEELLDEDEDADGRSARDGVDGERLVDDVHRRRRPRLGRGARDAELDGVRGARRPLLAVGVVDLRRFRSLRDNARPERF